MKTALIILDGASEEKLEELNGMTPLEFSYTPHLDKILEKGKWLKRTFYPFGQEPDSLNCILSILGLNEEQIPKSRAYFEALAKGIEIKEDEVVLRCNLISIKNDKLESFNALGLPKDMQKQISLNIKLKGGIKFFHISDYRNLIVIKKDESVLKLKNLPPHENLGIGIKDLINNYSEIELLKEFTEENIFEYNDTQHMFYPWGVSSKVNLPSFYSLHNKSSSIVCETEIVKGIAKAMKIEVSKLNNSTGDVDTDLKEKAWSLLENLKTYDVAIAHINGTDEVSHRKDLKGKIKFIEKIDKEFLSIIVENIISGTQIIILSDHQTSSITGKHEKGDVDVFFSS